MVKNYIFSHFELCNNASIEGITEFINSIIKNVPDSELCFFTNIEDSFNKEQLKFISLNKYITYYNHSCGRHFIYLNYLSSNNFDQDSNFIFCDCRDVVFLSNVFEKLKYFPNNCVIFGTEDSKRTLYNEPFNNRWIASTNVQNLLKFGNENIICAGCFIIKGLEMAKLFLYQFTLFIKYNVDILKLKDLIDQGLLNEFYYNFLINYKNNFMVLRNEQNCLFNHLGILSDTEFSFENGIFKQLNSGIEPSILHQYNRHKDLIKKIKELYNN